MMMIAFVHLLYYFMCLYFYGCAISYLLSNLVTFKMLYFKIKPLPSTHNDTHSMQCNTQIKQNNHLHIKCWIRILLKPRFSNLNPQIVSVSRYAYPTPDMCSRIFVKFWQEGNKISTIIENFKSTCTNFQHIQIQSCSK